MALAARAWTAAPWSGAFWTLPLLVCLLAALGAAAPAPFSAFPTAAAPVPFSVFPTAAGHFQFVAGSHNANPYFYPPQHADVRAAALYGHGQLLHGGVGLGAQDVRGGGAFLSGWDRERDLYSSRYAASALPMALPVGMAFPVAPVAVVNHFQPSQRLYGGRGRPAMVPTPYLKFSSHAASSSVDKGVHAAAAGPLLQHNSLVAFPEPGFYGRSGSGAQESVMLHGPPGLGYPETAAVGFYGKPL